MNNHQTLVNFTKVISIIEKYKRDASRIIPILQEVQAEYSFLPEEVMTFVANSLNISAAKVFGVATFYSHFALKPKGKYVIRICDGTACHVKGSNQLLEALRKKLHLSEENNTTPDMLFTIETVSCLGACGLAPVLVVNDDVYGAMTDLKTSALIDALIKQEEK